MTTPVIVFVGDSVTDGERRTDPSGLGDGYVRLLAGAPALAGWSVRNRGVSGDRVRDLRARWAPDVVAEDAAVVSVLVGVNDTWRRFDSDDPTTAAEYEHDYRALLEATSARLVLIEPFLLPVREEQESWREDLDEKIAVVRGLAEEFGAVRVSADEILRAAGDAAGLAPDGVHPSPRGHRVLADAWLAAAAPLLADIAK
ncbi:SGNH/GDSL hydrolase family protein [Microbacterium tumbae]